ncbi:MAG: hypothetical protein AAFV45_09915 [Pseudomonadota bacterium]
MDQRSAGARHQTRAQRNAVHTARGGASKVFAAMLCMLCGGTTLAHAKPALSANDDRDIAPTVKTTIKVIATTKPLDDRAPLDLIKSNQPEHLSGADGFNQKPHSPPMAEPLLIERSDDLIYATRGPGAAGAPSAQSATSATASVEEDLAPATVERTYRPRPRRAAKAASSEPSKTWKRSLALSFQEGD